MKDIQYIHGYEREERNRLIDQASYWRDLILHDNHYQAGESLLEIGCGVGAVLKILTDRFPSLNLTGIDIQDKQIGFAREYLSSHGHSKIDLHIGDARVLPWANESFDHIYMMWFLEHIKDLKPILFEAHRVLKKNGTITIHEADYSSI